MREPCTLWLCGLLGEDFEIVGTANNGRDAVVAVLRLNPDVLVIDISMPVISMPVLNGLQTALELRSAKKQTKVVFLTVHTDQDFVTAALAAGASGYVTKADVSTDLVPAISEALAGRIYVSKSIRTIAPIAREQEERRTARLIFYRESYATNLRSCKAKGCRQYAI